MALGSSSGRKWRAQRLRVLQRDQYSCYYCQEPANEVDHLLARVKGGSDDMDNLVAACRRCNNAKGPRSINLFLGGLDTPPVSPSHRSPVRASAPLTGPFEGQVKPQWI